jgi:hypothetical protein
VLGGSNAELEVMGSFFEPNFRCITGKCGGGEELRTRSVLPALAPLFTGYYVFNVRL